MAESGLAQIARRFDEPDKKIALDAEQEDIVENGLQAFAELEKLAKIFFCMV